MMSPEQRAKYDATLCDGIVAELNRLIAEGMTRDEAVAAIRAIWPTLAAIRERDQTAPPVN